MQTEKDKIALDELEGAIARLNRLLAEGKDALGKVQPVISAGEIALVKDHLDLAVHYAAIW